MTDNLQEYYIRFDDLSILRLTTYKLGAPCRWLYYIARPAVELTDDLLFLDAHITFRVILRRPMEKRDENCEGG